MHHHDITDPIEDINFKIAWFQRIARALVDASEEAILLRDLAIVREKSGTPTDIAMKLMPVLREEHPLYSSLIGNYICRAILEKFGLYDEIMRPSPMKVEMGRIADISIFYHSGTNEYEIANGNIGVRFPALYVPIFGMDIADEERAVEIALAIASLKKLAKPVFDIASRFPFLKLGMPVPNEKNSGKSHKNLIRNRHR